MIDVPLSIKSLAGYKHTLPFGFMLRWPAPPRLGDPCTPSATPGRGGLTAAQGCCALGDGSRRRRGDDRACAMAWRMGFTTRVIALVSAALGAAGSSARASGRGAAPPRAPACPGTALEPLSARDACSERVRERSNKRRAVGLRCTRRAAVDVDDGEAPPGHWADSTRWAADLGGGAASLWGEKGSLFIRPGRTGEVAGKASGAVWTSPGAALVALPTGESPRFPERRIAADDAASGDSSDPPRERKPAASSDGIAEGTSKAVPLETVTRPWTASTTSRRSLFAAAAQTSQLVLRKPFFEGSTAREHIPARVNTSTATTITSSAKPAAITAHDSASRAGVGDSSSE